MPKTAQKKKNKVNYNKPSRGLSHELKARVQAGNAHWVTIKEGPLEGRHILIDGPRPAEGEKSSGRILAGRGVPLHVIQKITGATNGSQLETHQTLESHIMNHLHKLRGFQKFNDFHANFLHKQIHEYFTSKGPMGEDNHVGRVIVGINPTSGKYTYRSILNDSFGDKTDAELARYFGRYKGMARMEWAVFHKDMSQSPVFNSSGELIDTEAKKAKDEAKHSKLHEFASNVQRKLQKFGIAGVEFNKESATTAEREHVAEVAEKAFNVMSKIVPEKALHKTRIKIVLGKLEHSRTAWAYYLPSNRSIYLTSKKNGMKPFYHEYGHALDHAIGNGQYSSETGILKPLIDAIRETQSHKIFINSISKPGSRWNANGKYGLKYFSSGRETFARWFAVYVQRKAGLKDIELPPELAEGDRFENYMYTEMKRLSKMFEDILDKNGLSKMFAVGGMLLIKKEEKPKKSKPKVKYAQPSKGLSHELRSKVAEGSAHWVTVKKGPLEGRHLLIDGPRPEEGKQSTGKILAGRGISLHIINKLGANHASDVEHEQKNREPWEMDFDEFKKEHSDLHPETARHQWMTSVRQKVHEDGPDSVSHLFQNDPQFEKYVRNGFKNKAEKKKIAGEGFPFGKEQTVKNNKFLAFAEGMFAIHEQSRFKEARKILHEKGYDAALNYMDHMSSGGRETSKMSAGSGKGKTPIEYLRELANEDKAKGNGLAPGQEKQSDENEVGVFHKPHQSGFSSDLGINNADGEGFTQTSFINGADDFNKPKQKTAEEREAERKQNEELDQKNKEFWNDPQKALENEKQDNRTWQEKELDARKAKRQQDLEQHKKDLTAIEAKMEKLNQKMHGDSHLNEVGKMFHLGRVGGSGNKRNINKLNQRRARELDRTIDLAHEWKQLHDKAETLRNRIKNIESGRMDAIDKMTHLKKPEYVKEQEKEQKAHDTNAFTEKDRKNTEKIIKEAQKMADQRKHLVQLWTEQTKGENDYKEWKSDVSNTEKAIAHMRDVLEHPENRLQYEEARRELSKWKKTMKDSFYGQNSYESELKMLELLKEHEAKKAARQAQKSTTRLYVAGTRLLAKRR